MTLVLCLGLVTVSAQLPSVTINKDKLSLEVGQSEVLTVEVVNDLFQHWMSSNASIATVDQNGKVNALAVGETIISAWGMERWGVCIVTVLPPSIHVNGVSLDKNSLKLTEGEAETLTVTVYPADATNKSVVWTSDNLAVASVDAKGKIKAISSGKALIEVTSVDGNYSASCEVNVVKPHVSLALNAFPATGGSLNGEGSYAIGTSVTVKAIPNDNYIFKQWELNGVVVSTEVDYTFIINADTELLAVFAENSSNSIEQLAADGIHVSVFEKTLYIQPGKKPEPITVYTINGQCLYKNVLNNNSLVINELPQGLVILTVGKHSEKILIP